MKINQLQKNKITEWQEVKLADIGVFSKGAGISKKQLSESGNNAIRYGELYTKHDFQIKKIYSFIKDDVASQSKEIKYGDILFAGSGETINEIGKSAAYLLKEKAYAGGDIIIFTPKNANSLFLSYFLNIEEGRKRLSKMGEGQSIVHIYKSDMEKLRLRLPARDEQNRIVAVLEIWDKAIEKLSRKIEIKNQIKKGLMQELLTGKKRLKGFSGEWEAVRLGKFTKEINEYTQRHNEVDILTSARSGLVLQSDYFKKQVTSENNTGYKIIRKGEFTYRTMSDSNIFSFNRLKIIEIGAISPAYPVFKVEGINPDFIDFLIKTPWFIHQAYKYSQGGTRLSLKFENLNEVKIRVPDNKEQTAIAQILTTADEEIETLEDKLSLLKEQKRYLLNNLITGIIRVPETLSIKANEYVKNEP